VISWADLSVIPISEIPSGVEDFVGTGIISLAVNGQTTTFVGTSAAAPFVTGAIALLLSIFPNAKATVVKQVITAPFGTRRATVVPPLMDASAAYRAMRGVGSSGE
jgi:subtilisin family serine protease